MMTTRPSPATLVSAETAQQLALLAKETGQSPNRLLHQLVQQAMRQHQQQELGLSLENGVSEKSPTEMLLLLGKTLDGWLDAQCGAPAPNRRARGA